MIAKALGHTHAVHAGVVVSATRDRRNHEATGKRLIVLTAIQLFAFKVLRKSDGFKRVRFQHVA